MIELDEMLAGDKTRKRQVGIVTSDLARRDVADLGKQIETMRNKLAIEVAQKEISRQNAPPI